MRDPLRFLCAALISALAVAESSAAVPGEKELRGRLPGVFSRIEKQYRAMEALVEAQPAERNLPIDVCNGRNRFGSVFDWTSGFYPGSLWYLYEYTRSDEWKNAAIRRTAPLEAVRHFSADHDVGFMLYCSAGNGYRLDVNRDIYQPWLMDAAKALSSRFRSDLGLIQSWDARELAGAKMQRPVIIDNMMNLELLMFAAARGDADAERIARSHANVTDRRHFRPDGSAYHVVDYRRDSTNVFAYFAGQGASADGAWSRGQAWALYGFTMMFRLTRDERYRRRAVSCAEWLLRQNLPEDLIPYWDFSAPDIPDEPRDSSAAAIAASALLELQDYVEASQGRRYRERAVRMLLSLTSDAYFAKAGENGNFLLKHATGFKPNGGQIDVPIVYADYYFLEALVRFNRPSPWTHWPVPGQNRARVDEIAAMLPLNPRCPGAEIDDRAAWERISRERPSKRVMHEAEKVLAQPMSPWDRAAYDRFRKFGDRRSFETPFFARLGEFTTLVLAECLENKGRFIARISDYIEAMCNEPTWVVPMHDLEQGTLHGAEKGDIFSCRKALEMATACAWLGSRLDPELVARVEKEIHRRILSPFYADMRLEDGTSGAAYRNHWVNIRNNWIAVCGGCTLATVFIIEKDRRIRAEAAEFVERLYPRFRHAYDEDGYCTEGVGYWNFGFGNALELGFTIFEATDGRWDFLSENGGRDMAKYGIACQVEKGRSAWFADGGGAPFPDLLWMIAGRWPDLVPDSMLAPPETGGSQFDSRGGWRPNLYRTAFTAFGAKPKGTAADALPVRSWYPHAQVLIGRPEHDSARSPFSVALKGGNNDEAHNHNDLGSYVVLYGGVEMAGDPGGEIYTARTFSDRRYDSKMINSYGHPVPVIDGRLQTTGRAASAKVIRTAFTDKADSLILDLSLAYVCPALERMERHFTYNRAAPSFMVADHAEFSSSVEFETPFVTYCDVRELAKGAYELTDRTSGRRLMLSISVVGDAEWRLQQSQIENPGRPTVSRYAVRFLKPVRKASVVFDFRPVK